MKPESSLEVVASLMNDLRFITTGTFTLIATNKRLQLIPNKGLPRYCCIIDKFSPKVMSEGLTSERWNELHAKILSLIHKGLLK